MQNARSLRTRIPGQSVLSEVIRSHGAAPKRTRFATIFGASPLTAENRSWYRGALGELVVGNALDRLSPEWDVLHAVPVGSGNSDIDHVVIGPAGVFTVNTKNHTGQDVWVAGSTVMVAGQRQPHLRNSQFEAERASILLSAAAGHPVAVTPLLVIVDPKKLTIRERATGVEVVTARQVERWFARAPRTLSGDEVARISDVADLATTWHTAPGPEQDTHQLFVDFAKVRHEVRSAIRRRVFWAFGAFCLAYGLIWGALAVFVAETVGN